MKSDYSAYFLIVGGFAGRLVDILTNSHFIAVLSGIALITGAIKAAIDIEIWLERKVKHAIRYYKERKK